MSHAYRAVGWNWQKRIYDLTLLGGVLLYLAVFIGAGALLRPNATIETLLIRALGTAALLLLHIVLSIGPPLPAGLALPTAALQPPSSGRDHVPLGSGAWRLLDRPVSRLRKRQSDPECPDFERSLG